MYDTIILGNGIAGMSAAIYAKRAGLNFKIIGEEEFSVGQIENAILVENYPGIKAISGYDLGNSIKEQMEEIGITVEEKEVVSIEKIESTIEQLSDFFTVKYSDGTESHAETIIYALGSKHRELSEICNIKDNVTYHHCAICDGALYKGKNVAIIGGGNTAFTEALYLSKIASTVRIITDKIIADSTLINKVCDTKNISVIDNAKITFLYKENGSICIDYKYKDAMCKNIVDGLFAAIGSKPQSQYCPDGVQKSYSGYVIANECGETDIEGFYVAGDIRRKTLRQAITAAADGANCANSVNFYLQNNKNKSQD